jgi:hypothetical protein
MSITVWLSTRTLNSPKQGGHFWAYLNWALGVRALGCDLVWLEPVSPRARVTKVQALVDALKSRLEPYDLADQVALCSSTNEPLSSAAASGCKDIEAASEADLLLNMAYGISPALIRRFRRSALLDIDPGLTQIWMSKKEIGVSRHDVYLTIGETVGQPGSAFPDCGLEWQYTPPCVALDWWPVHSAPAGAPFTTVSNWYMDEWIEDANGWYINDKRSGFLPFLDLPSQTSQPLELALCLSPDEEEGWVELPNRGWIVRNAWETVPSPRDYQRYIQGSRGEFSCVKPSCVRLQNAWVSDRTLCYLDSGKPAVVQHTGPSRFLPDSAGLFRFRDLHEAVRYLDIVARNYDQQCRLARALAEEHFDAKKVVKGVLERALA